MSEDLNKRHKAALDVALMNLDDAAIPTKSDVFVRCGPAARDLHDAITDLRQRLQAAEERAAVYREYCEADDDVRRVGRLNSTSDQDQRLNLARLAFAALKTEGA